MSARRVWPFAFLLLVCVLRFVWREADERNGLAFEVTAGGPEAQTMQLYFQRDPDTGLSEAASVVVAMEPGDLRVYRFRLDAGAYRLLRFDPMKQGGHARFKDARIVEGSRRREQCALPVATWQVGQNIQRATLADQTLEVEVAPGQDDPTFIIPLSETPLILRRSLAPRLTYSVLALLATVGLITGLARYGKWPSHARRASAAGTALLSGVERRISRVIPPQVLPVDRRAIVFLAALLLATVSATVLDIHGSSSSIRGKNGVPIGTWTPLFGTPKNIRNDEWNVHTPLILYQVNRADAFAVESIVGPGNSSLIANVPVRHWSTLFRPQFFSFFVLPTTHAFAAYWQCKNLLLVAGTFLLFLLLTRSSPMAIFGSLWFWLSSYTQWAFSWPALLPEMIGLICLAVVAAALTFVARSRGAAGVFGGIFVLTTVDFALCSYPPFQIPLAWAGAGIGAAWLLQMGLIARTRPVAGDGKNVPATGPEWRQGWVTLAVGILVIGATMTWFLREIRPVVEITAHTLYPGNRSVSGGGVSWQQLVSALLDPFKEETHVPSQFMNICEGSGYFWLGPITLLGAVRIFKINSSTHGRGLYFALFVPLLFLLSWTVLPIPAKFGRVLLLDMAMPHRVTPALGLLSISITVVFLQLVHQNPTGAALGTTLLRRWRFLVTTTIGALVLFWVMNRGLGHHFAGWHLALTAVALGIVSVALMQGWTQVVATMVMMPLLSLNFLINPIDRGLDVYEHSALRRFVDEHPCRDGGWLVVSDNGTASQYFAALGLDVVNVMNYVPFLDRWKKFDPHGDLAGYYNGAGATLISMLPPGGEARFEAIPWAPLGPPLFKRFSVDPADARLREIGVRYFALQGAADPRLFPATAFEQMTAAPVDGFTLYRIN